MSKDKNPATGTYSMRVVSRLTGLTPDTIRMWERRYRAVLPARSEGKTRRFSDADVRRLIALRQATERGHRIGNIASLSEKELEELVAKESALAAGADDQAPDLQRPESHFRALRQLYVDLILRFEAAQASELLSRTAALLNRDALLFQFVRPVLCEIGDMWEGGELSPAHEHLVSAQIRGILDALMRYNAALPGAPKIVVTTPADHLHEFGAVLGSLMAATRGFQVIYLGPNLPEEDIRLAVESSRADIVLLAVLSDMDPEGLASFDGTLEALKEIAETWVGMPPDHIARGRVEGVRYFVRFEDLEAALASRISVQAGQG